MGLSGSDHYTAYCLDEAVFLWGSYVESELAKARNAGKNAKQSENKAKLRFHVLMSEPEQEVSETKKGGPEDEHADFPKHLPRKAAPSKFRDPMDRFRKKD